MGGAAGGSPAPGAFEAAGISACVNDKIGREDGGGMPRQDPLASLIDNFRSGG